MRPVLTLLLLFPAVASADPARRDLYGDPLPEGAIQRLGTARMKHPGASRISVAPDGETVVTLAYDRIIRLWSARTGKLLKGLSYSPPDGQERNISSDGLRFVIIDKQVVQVWDLENRKVTHRLPLKGVDRLTAVAFSTDPNVIATAEDTPREYRIRVWDLKKGTQREIGHTEEPITVLGFASPTRIFSRTDADVHGASSQLWDLEDANRSRFFPRPVPLCFQPNNPWVALTKRDADPLRRDWEIWDLRRDEPAETFPGDNTTRCVGVSPDGSRLLSRGTGGANLLDRKTKNVLATFPPGATFAFSPDAKHLYLLENYALLRKIDAISGQSVWEASDRIGGSVPADLRWLPDSRFLLASYKSNPVSAVYDSRSGRVAGTITHAPEIPPIPYRDGAETTIFSTGTGFERRGWRDAKLGEPSPVELPRGLIGPWRRVGLSPDGKRLEVTQLDASGERNVYRRIDLASKTVVAERLDRNRSLNFQGPKNSDFSLDGRFLHDESDLFFPGTGEAVPPREGQASGSGMTLSDRTDLIAGNHNREFALPNASSPQRVVQYDLRIWERFTGRTLVEFKDTGIRRGAFHPSGRFLATDHPDGVRVWNLLSSKLERLIPCHDATFNDSLDGPCAYRLAFSPDGTKLATGHGDTTVLIWDTSDLPPAPRERLDAAAIEKLWQTLGEPDAKPAWAAHWKLAGSPETVLPFLQEHLRPVRGLTRKEVQPLLDELESNDFRKREAATRKVNELDEAFLPLAQELLAGDIGEDLRRRLAPIPKKKRWNVPPTGEDLRLMRVVRLLETIGGAEALRLVEKLSEGAAAARATQEAVAARERMRHGKGSE
jgi:WD40 repeat protein